MRGRQSSRKVSPLGPTISETRKNHKDDDVDDDDVGYDDEYDEKR